MSFEKSVFLIEAYYPIINSLSYYLNYSDMHWFKMLSSVIRYHIESNESVLLNTLSYFVQVL